MYGVKIDQIRLLNNLSSNDIYLGEKLLVQKGATQPVPSPTASKTPLLRAVTPSSTPLQTVTPQPTPPNPAGEGKPVTFYVGVGIIGATVLGALFLLFSKGKAGK
jgi:LysM repeat protein